MSDNAQPDQWSGDRVAGWLRQSAGIERQLAPVSDVLFAAARLQPGESVLDVGCGTGPTTLAAARAVGRHGRVRGLDVSGEMLAAAASNAPDDDDAAPIEWVEADAVTWTPDGPVHDVVISRFGVMFFSNPAVAFANLASATRAGGRLTVAVWQRRDESAVFSVPFHAVIEVLRAHGIRSTAAGVDLDHAIAADDEGPFSLNDPDDVTNLLEHAGWTDVVVEPHTLELEFAGGVAPAAAAAAAVDFGPTRIVLAGQDDEVLRVAQDAIREAFTTHVNGDGQVVLSGSVNIISALRR